MTVLATPPRVLHRDVMEAVTLYFDITEAELKGPSQRGAIVEARGVYILLASKLMGQTCAAIGAALGGRGRFGVVKSQQRMAARAAADPAFRAELDQLAATIREVAALRASKAIRGALPREPMEVARAVCQGGDRAAMGVTVDEVRLLCAELLALADAQHADEEPEEEPAPVSWTVTPPVTAATPPEAQAAISALAAAASEKLREAPPRGLPPGLYDVAHDFIGAEAVRRKSPSLNRPETRSAHIPLLKPFEHEPEVASVLRTLAHWRASEETAGEKDARERYERAVKALAARILTGAKEVTAHV